MYGHLGLPQIGLPSSLTGRHNRHTRDATPSKPLAIGFGWAIGSAITAMVMGATVLTAAPHTVTVPIATVLGFGMITSTIVAVGDQWRAIRRPTQQDRR